MLIYGINSKRGLESQENYYSGESAGAVYRCFMSHKYPHVCLNEVHAHLFRCIGIRYDQVKNILLRDAYK